MIPQVYRDVDILKSLGRIVDQHTKEFKEDFELDKKIILKMAQSPDENDHHLIWMCRPLGTHCFAERDVFLENTFENRGLYAYHSEKPNKNLLYALHLKWNDGDTVKGDIYTLDYTKEVERVSLLSCPVTQVNKDELTKVSLTLRPAADNDLFPDIFRTKAAAVAGALHAC